MITKHAIIADVSAHAFDKEVAAMYRKFQCEGLTVEIQYCATFTGTAIQYSAFIIGREANV